jgi:PAS domain S-box-containing protein
VGAIDVLVVEDSPEIRDLVRFSLGLDPSFCVVGEAGDPIEALPLVSEYEPDVVLLDLAMPRMGGLEAIDHVRRASPGSAIVIYSSLLEQHQGPRARELGADAYLEKGASIDTMREILRGAAEKRAAEHQPGRSAQRRLQTIVDSASDAIVAWSIDGLITDWNPGAERLYGFKAAEALGQTTDMFTPPARQAHARAVQQRVIRDGVVQSFEATRVRKDGSEVEVAGTASPLRDDHGTIVGAMGISRDVSAQREADAELARSRVLIERQNAELGRSNTELEQFAYVASHDLQEPLRVIGGFVDLLRQRYEGQLDDDADRFIAATISGVERMGQLIDDLLVYSRVGRSEAAREQVDTAATVNRVLERLAEPIAERRLEVRLGPLPVVSGDPILLEQIFQNLISNAVKFSDPDEPILEIEGVEDGDSWRFVVADNGAGIEERHREQIFEMFKRLHGRTVPGTGIGLAICKRIAERHGGRIWVEDRPAGGSAFTFTLQR